MAATPSTGRLERAYDVLTRVEDLLRSPLLLAIRLCWGWQFFEAGKGKLENFERTVGFFDKLHIPAPTLNAAMAATTECVGGLLLVLGLGARVATIPLIVTMCVAYATAHWQDVKDVESFTAQPPFPFLLASLIVLVFGPGVFSLDALIARLRGRKRD